MSSATVLRGALLSSRALSTRCFSSTSSWGKQRNFPTSADEMPRSGGIASFMRLPVQKNTEGLDACFVGIPLDAGVSNRTGTRHGPRHIRQESCFIRGPANYVLGVNPFEDLQVADVGDVSINIYDLPKAVKQIKEAYDKMIANGCIPLTIGGDHTTAYPILQAMKAKYGPVGLVQIDAHADTTDLMLGAPIAHGTPLKRASEEDLLDSKRVVQIGLRGPLLDLSDYDCSKEKGFRIVMAKDCWNKSLVPLMAEVRQMMGKAPVYITIDIDGVDPSFAPATGTPELGGLTTAQCLEIIHGCAGLNIVGGDVVEVSPPYDIGGLTSLTAAHFLFEMLSVLPGVKRRTQ